MTVGPVTPVTPEGAEPTRPRRPRGVTVVAVAAFLQAVLFVVVGLVALLAEPTADLREALELDSSTIRVGGAVFLTIGIVEAGLAVLLARGHDGARSVFGILQTVHVGTAVYGLVALRDVRLQSLWALALPVLVLWLLYGSESVAEFFDR